MLTVPDWLPEFVSAGMSAAIREEPGQADWIREADGIRLFGTIGAEAFLRSDGSVRYYEAVAWVNDPARYEWREGKGNDRWAALVLGSRRIPQLRALLPTRPPNAPNCARCNGRGELFTDGKAEYLRSPRPAHGTASFAPIVVRWGGSPMEPPNKRLKLTARA